MLHGQLPTRRRRYLLAPLFLVIALGQVSNGATIVSVSGPLEGGFYPIINFQADASSWTTSKTYINVAFTALLEGALTGGPPPQGTAYLTTQIGPGTTTANEIARNSFAFPSTLAVGTVTLFSGLTLSPGTYFLVLSSPFTSSGGWRDAFDCGSICSFPAPTITLDVGVTRNMDFISNGPINVYAPASSFVQGFGVRGGDLFLQYAVTTVPEPATLTIVGNGLLAIACAFGRRRWTTLAGKRRFPAVPAQADPS